MWVRIAVAESNADAYVDESDVEGEDEEADESEGVYDADSEWSKCRDSTVRMRKCQKLKYRSATIGRLNCRRAQLLASANIGTQLSGLICRRLNYRETQMSKAQMSGLVC